MFACLLISSLNSKIVFPVKTVFDRIIFFPFLILKVKNYRKLITLDCSAFSQGTFPKNSEERKDEQERETGKKKKNDERGVGRRLCNQFNGAT